MLTLKKHPDNVELCLLKTGKKKVPIYWHPVRNPELRNAVSDVKGFDSEAFRDRFGLSPGQSNEILDHLNSSTTPEGPLQKVFFKIKRFIEDRLYSEMNLGKSNQELVLPYPPGNDTWGELMLCCGASSSGKSHYLFQRVKDNLDGPEKNRRRFTIISNEYNKDKTIDKLGLRSEKYRNNIHGIDVSESSLENSPHDTGQQFYDKEVKPFIDEARPGQILIFDDSQDACCNVQLRHIINRLQRCARHDGVGLAFILHCIRSGIWSSQASSSCKYFVLFPRSQRGKCRDFLNKELGCTLGEAREHVYDFAQSGRAMTVRLFSPQCLIGEKMIRLL